MKLERIENWRVEVQPCFSPLDDSEERKKRRCREIASEIRRHCDSVEQVTVQFERVAYCSHCRAKWEVDEAGYPMCCEAAHIEGIKETVGHKRG